MNSTSMYLTQFVSFFLFNVYTHGLVIVFVYQHTHIYMVNKQTTRTHRFGHDGRFVAHVWSLGPSMHGGGRRVWVLLHRSSALLHAAAGDAKALQLHVHMGVSVERDMKAG